MWLLSPLSWLLISLVLLLAGCTQWRARRWPRRVAWGGVALSLLAMTPAFANRLVALLEGGQEMPVSCPRSQPEVGVLLSGGMDRFPRSPEDLSVLDIGSRRRAEKALAWWSEAPGHRRLVVAGGAPQRGVVPVAVLMAGYLQRMGVPARAILLESDSRNTWENARNLAAVRPALPREVVLITSAMHMRRARHSMAQWGFSVCPLAADWRYVPFRRPGYLLPDSGGLHKTEAALHEIVGLAYYRLRYRGVSSEAAGAPPP